MEDKDYKIVTFFSHYDAQLFAKRIFGSKVRPVPRSVSSSCGDCASIPPGIGDGAVMNALEGIEADSFFEKKDGRYVRIRTFSDSSM